MNSEPEVAATENKIEETTESEGNASGATEPQGLSGEAIKRLSNSQEMKNFYRALAAVQTSVMLRVRGAKNEEVMKKLLIDATKRLENATYDKCQPPQTWDPVLGKCV